MMNRFGLDRFKKATAAEPFSVTQKVSSIPIQQQQEPQHLQRQSQVPTLVNARLADAPTTLPPVTAPPVPSTALGAGGSTWQPPDWAVDPKCGVYWLDVMKDGDVVDKISLDRKRLIFGRQHVMCDLVLDHPSVSRQHAAIVHHKNGSIYGIDLGSVHGTFIANERLTKENPVELEVGQTLRFAASTRIYVLRKSVPTPVIPVPTLANIVLPPPPDSSDEEAVLAYNTSLNRLGVSSSSTYSFNSSTTSRRSGSNLHGNRDKETLGGRPTKRARKGRVSFRDDYGGVLAEVVGVSDGADVSTEPGPVGVREGSLVGKYESLVQVTVIPRGQQDMTKKTETGMSQGMTPRLQQYLHKVKAPGKSGGIYGDIYGESLAGIAGGSWASSQNSVHKVHQDEEEEEEGTVPTVDDSKEKLLNGLGPTKPLMTENSTVDVPTKTKYDSKYDANFNDDDLFGEDEDT